MGWQDVSLVESCLHPSPAREEHLQGLEKTGLLRIRAGQACDAVRVVQGIGQPTEPMERVKRVLERDSMGILLRRAVGCC